MRVVAVGEICDAVMTNSGCDIEAIVHGPGGDSNVEMVFQGDENGGCPAIVHMSLASRTLRKARY